MKVLSTICLLFFIAALNAQCIDCVFHEVDPVTDIPICDLPSNPIDTCLVAVDTCFSGSVSSAFFNTPIVDDPIDAQYFTIPADKVITEIEWCITDQAVATSGSIQVGSYSNTFTGLGNGDMFCMTATLSPPIPPGVHSFKIEAAVPSLNFLNWKIKLKLTSCDSMIILTTQESGIVDNESIDWIVSSQILNSGAQVDYDAVDSIMLKSNFHAKLGSTFHAFIDGCGGI